MKKLPETLTKNGYFYVLIERESYKAIYGQCRAEGTVPFAYEVFYIREQKPSTTTMGTVEITFEHKELFPNNEEFGKNAWSFTNRENAIDFYQKMLPR